MLRQTKSNCRESRALCMQTIARATKPCRLQKSIIPLLEIKKKKMNCTLQYFFFMQTSQLLCFLTSIFFYRFHEKQQWRSRAAAAAWTCTSQGRPLPCFSNYPGPVQTATTLSLQTSYLTLSAQLTFCRPLLCLLSFGIQSTTLNNHQLPWRLISCPAYTHFSLLSIEISTSINRVAIKKLWCEDTCALMTLLNMTTYSSWTLRGPWSNCTGRWQ